MFTAREWTIGCRKMRGQNHRTFGNNSFNGSPDLRLIISKKGAATREVVLRGFSLRCFFLLHSIQRAQWPAKFNEHTYDSLRPRLFEDYKSLPTLWGAAMGRPKINGG